jgi:hypothetical protein
MTSRVEAERLPRGLASVDTLSDAASREGQPFAPFSNGCLYSVVEDDDVVTPVPVLLGSRGPATVLGRVRSIVVDSVDSVLRRGPLAHIREESLKRVHPSPADRDAAAAVVDPGGNIAVRAAAFDVIPGPMLDRSGLAVCRHGIADSSALAAPTRLLRIPEEPEFCGAPNHFIPANAHAPTGTLLLRANADPVFNDGQVTKLHPYHEMHVSAFHDGTQT